MTDETGHAYLRTHTLQAEHLQLDLPRVVEELRAAAAGADRRAVTLVRESGLSVVLVYLRRGTELAEHATPGAATVHVLEGRARIRVGDAALDAGAQQLVAFDARAAHGVIALEDTALLLTISAPPPAPLQEAGAA